jgi:hypothetical protein
MRKKIILPLLLSYLCLIPIYSWCQHTEIRGKILDKETHEVVPFSTISMKDGKIGTCSNSRGEFIFHCPDSLKGSDLKICCIGYKTKVIQLNTLPSTEIATIYLESELYEISEIQVGPNPPTAADIVKLVIRNMHKNYPRSPYYMEGFLRDKCFNLMDKTSTRLTEAAVEIRKKEFGNENNADRVKVIEIRNSYNYSKRGSLWKEKLTRAFWGYSTDNPLYNVLQYQDFTDSKSLKELSKNDLYSINFSGMTIYDGKPVQIIDIKEEYYEFMFQRKKSNNLYSLIRLYIDTETCAMLKSEYYTITKIPPEKLEGVKFYFKQDTIGTYSVKMYENIQDKYYLKYAEYFGRMHDQPDIGDDKTLYFNETELLINKVITSKKDFDRIKHRDLLEKETPLWDMKYVYDPSFWKNYNILIDKPLDPTVQKDLEKEVPLYDQFIDAGVKNSTTPK